MREKWTSAAEGADEKVVGQYNLLGNMDSIREEHVKFISELARYNNEVCIYDEFNFLPQFDFGSQYYQGFESGFVM